MQNGAMHGLAQPCTSNSRKAQLSHVEDRRVSKEKHKTELGASLSHREERPCMAGEWFLLILVCGVQSAPGVMWVKAEVAMSSNSGLQL